MRANETQPIPFTLNELEAVIADHKEHEPEARARTLAELVREWNETEHARRDVLLHHIQRWLRASDRVGDDVAMYSLALKPWLDSLVGIRGLAIDADTSERESMYARMVDYYNTGN